MAQKQQNNTPWKDWTGEDWENAVYCDDCGLPLLSIPSEDDGSTGYHICVYCTWKSDEAEIAQQEINKIKKSLKTLKNYLH